MIALVPMPERKARPDGPVDNIDEAERVAINARMASKGISKADLARDCGVTPAAITLLLSKPIPRGKTRGCKFLAKLQASLGLAVTAKRPAVIPNDRQRRAELILKALGDDQEALDHWFSNGEMLASRARKPL